MMHFPHISMGAKHPKFNISAKQDLPLHDSRIGAFDYPWLLALLKKKKNDVIKGDTDHSENLLSNL